MRVHNKAQRQEINARRDAKRERHETFADYRRQREAYVYQTYSVNLDAREARNARLMTDWADFMCDRFESDNFNCEE